MSFERGARAAPRATEAVLVGTLLLTAGAVVSFRVQAPETEIGSQLAGAYLWLFLGLFFLRVVGQIVVLVRAPC